MDERRVGLGEVIRTVNRIDARTARMEAALFEERGIIGRVLLLEQSHDDDKAERQQHRIMAGLATFVGSAIGAAAAYFGGHK